MPRPNANRPSQQGNQTPWRPPQPRPVKYRTSGGFNPALVDAEADQQAQQLAGVTESQLRRFYEYVLSLRRRLDVKAGLDPEARRREFEALRPEFLMLKARAVYAHRRSEKQFPQSALQFFIDHTTAVRTAQDFDDFCRHFEAVVGFHKAYCKKERD